MQCDQVVPTDALFAEKLVQDQPSSGGTAF